MIKRRIYISPADDKNLDRKQPAIKRAILRAIEKEGFELQEFAPSAWNFNGANQNISRCQGAVIFAFARWSATPTKHQDESDYPMKASEQKAYAPIAYDPSKRQVSLTSEHNHFDGALAFSHKVPLLIIANEDVRKAGILLDRQGLMVVFWPDYKGPEWINEEYSDFQPQFRVWCNQVKARSHVFLGYCSKARSTAFDIARYMEHYLKLTVREYSMDFLAGGSILEQIEEAARDCACGVFLFTKDDPLEGRDGDAAPRDNVIFEAGYFMHAKGKERVLIIREEGSKMPADLGGNIYIPLKDRNDISGIHTQLRQFLENRL